MTYHSDSGVRARLLVDSMLGSLGRWLRLLGYDAAQAGDGPDIALIRQARAENRIILTRDRQLATHRGAKTLFIASETLDEQLLQVARQLPLEAPSPGTRCVHCNEPLEVVTRRQVVDAVPPYVLRTQESFRRCQSCGQVYWRGSHWTEIEAKLALMDQAERPAQ